MKEVYFYPSGEIFTKIENESTYVKLITINLSEFIVTSLFRFRTYSILYEQ